MTNKVGLFAIFGTKGGKYWEKIFHQRIHEVHTIILDVINLILI